MKRRILALCLAIVMVLGMVPTFAMAAETAEPIAMHIAALKSGPLQWTAKPMKTAG